MATSVNYIGRKVDILIFQGWKQPGEGSASISLGFGNTGYVVTGIMKLVQQFILLFLTEEGTSKEDLLAGTSFMSMVRTGAIRTEAVLKSAFGMAAADVRNQLNASYDQEAEKGYDVPLDERISSVTLLSFYIEPGRLELSIKILSKAGETRTVVLPVQVAIS